MKCDNKGCDLLEENDTASARKITRHANKRHHR